VPSTALVSGGTPVSAERSVGSMTTSAPADSGPAVVRGARDDHDREGAARSQPAPERGRGR
jgi:hypothetical protein